MATTGTGTGSDFSGLNDAMKYVYEPAFATNIEGEQEVLGVFQDVGDFDTKDGPDGKGIQIPMYMSAGGGVSAMLEDDYMPTNTTPLFKQATATIKQITVRNDLSGRAMRRVKEGPAGLAEWASMSLTEKAKRVAFHMDRMAVGTGTGVVGRINGSPDATGDAIDTAYGIAGLEGAINLFLVGDNLRYAGAADGSSPRTGVATVTNINYAAGSGAGTFDTAALPTSAVDNDFVFVGDANVFGKGARELTGLEAHIDDGSNVTTYQGLTRSSYQSVLYSQIVDSTAYGTAPASLSENILDFAAAQAWERAGGRTNLILCNRNGQRSFWNSLKGDRAINDPQGQYQGGKRDAGLLMHIGNDLVQVRAARKVPASRCYGIDTSTMHKYQIGQGRWDDTTGSIWRPVVDSTGFKDAYASFFIAELEYACSHPARNFKITGLATA